MTLEELELRARHDAELDKAKQEAALYKEACHLLVKFMDRLSEDIKHYKLLVEQKIK